MPQLEDQLISTETVQFCTISGDPGCLGWPSWHEGDCIYIEVKCHFCKCGGHDVYDYGSGEICHEEGCPLYRPPVTNATNVPLTSTL